MRYLCVEYVCNYFRERRLGQIDPTESIPALEIEFRALLRHLPSGAPNRATNSVLKNVKESSVGLCTDYTLNGLVFESVFQSGTWQTKSRYTSFLGHAKI